MAASGHSSRAIRPSTAFELNIACKARAAPGASRGVEGSTADRHALTASSATRALEATCATSGSSSAVRLTRARAASALPSRPRPTTARSRTRGSASVNASMNGAAGIRAASSLRSDRASRANSRTFASPASFTRAGIDAGPSSCSSVKIAATRGASGPSAAARASSLPANAGRLPRRRIARCAARRRTCPGAARHSMSCASVAARRSGQGGLASPGPVTRIT